MSGGAKPTEADLIRAIAARTRTTGRTPRIPLGIGDDCAILRPPRGHELLVTTDFSLETIHFRRDWHPPESAGHRCLARGLSDLAAMGAAPLAIFLSLALPPELLSGRNSQPAWRERFLDGLLALARKHRVPLAGGDTAASPATPLPGTMTGLALADIVALGTAPQGRALRRSGAKPGDALYVTGALGGAAAELAQLAASPRRFARLRAQADTSAHPHLFPQPRLKVGQWLAQPGRASACIDVSDGLSTDLHHLCEASHCAAIVEAARLPIHPLAAATKDGLQLALHGGEDYELLFTAPASVRVPRRIGGVPVTRIGTIRRARRSQPTAALFTPDQQEQPLSARGWEHFRTAPL